MYYPQDGCEETFAEHGSYKADCKGDVADETWSRMLSHKFETEPEKYLEEKLLNALMEQLLVGFYKIFFIRHFPLQVGVAEEMQPAVQEHSERLATEVRTCHLAAHQTSPESTWLIRPDPGYQYDPGAGWQGLGGAALRDEVDGFESQWTPRQKRLH